MTLEFYREAIRGMELSEGRIFPGDPQNLQDIRTAFRKSGYSTKEIYSSYLGKGIEFAKLEQEAQK